MECFPETVGIVGSQSHINYKFEGPVLSWYTYKSLLLVEETQRAVKFRTRQAVCPHLGSREKKVHLVEGNGVN